MEIGVHRQIVYQHSSFMSNVHKMHWAFEFWISLPNDQKVNIFTAAQESHTLIYKIKCQIAWICMSWMENRPWTTKGMQREKKPSNGSHIVNECNECCCLYDRFCLSIEEFRLQSDIVSKISYDTKFFIWHARLCHALFSSLASLLYCCVLYFFLI